MKKRISLTIYRAAFLFAALFLLISASVQPNAAQNEVAQPAFIDFIAERWDLQAAEVTDFLGRKALAGFATLKDVEFENGVIEVDIAVDGRSSYPGIVFRTQTDQDYERIYVRPHRESLYPDAVQYVSAFNGIDSWQLYNGEGYTAGAQLPYNKWTHMKLEVSGSQARLFLNNAPQPALEIDHLQHGMSKGGIALSGPRDRSAYFSNFQLRADSTLKFAAPPEREPSPGIISDWEISQVFKMNRVDLEKTPGQQGITDIQWQKVTTLRNGMVDVSRYHGREGTDPDCIWARTTITSDKDEVRQIAFGYSDFISIFLNGSIVFGANSAYRQRDPSFLGIVGLNDYVYLPLKKGKNELLICLVESFGGWGFIFQDANAIFEHERLTKIWELQYKLQYPESVVYDKKRDIIYVSNFFNNGNEFISKVKLNGEIETLQWMPGLNRPSGLFLNGDTLYTVDRTGLVKIDIVSGAVTGRFPIPGARFPNDVAMDAYGNIYISDSAANLIHRFSDDKFEIWLQSAETLEPNGLLVDGKKLIMGTSSDGCIRSIDLADKTVRRIACLGSDSIMDGLKSDGKGNYIVSDFNGRVFLISPSGEKTQLLDTRTPQRYCADFEYIQEKNLLIIPTLNDNRLVVYKFAQ